MSSERTRLFAYGTLPPGFPLHRHLRESAVRFLGIGTIRGKRYDLGEFPGAVISSSENDEIQRELYGLCRRQVKALDEIEEFHPNRPGKSLFIRRVVDVRPDTSQILKAWAYFLSHKPTKAHLLPRGDYAVVRQAAWFVRARR